MGWHVLVDAEFAGELAQLPEAVRDEISALALLLAEVGPGARRPHSDTLNGSRFANMKELRFDAEDGVWRVAYAFDPLRNAVLLCGADKSGVSQRRFYKALIAKADRRFAAHLARLNRETSA